MSDVITVVGNLTSPPERRELPGGGIVAKFGLASTERKLENGTWVDKHTSYYNVSVFRKLGEHALASLQRGQRVIVTGKLRIRDWENSERRGTSADLDATALGPDLMFGVATFVKDATRGATYEAPQSSTPAPMAPADAWAAPGTTPQTFDGAPDADAPGEPAVIPDDARQLVAVGGIPDDETPF